MEASLLPLNEQEQFAHNRKLEIVLVGDALTNQRYREWLSSCSLIKTITTIDYHQATQQISSLEESPELAIINVTGTYTGEEEILQLVADCFKKVLVICREENINWLSLHSGKIKGIILAHQREQLNEAIGSISMGQCYFSRASLLSQNNCSDVKISDKTLHQSSCYVALLLLEKWRNEPRRELLSPKILLKDLWLESNQQKTKLVKFFQQSGANQSLEDLLAKKLRNLREICQQKQFSVNFNSYANSIIDWLSLDSVNCPGGVHEILEKNEVRYTTIANSRLRRYLSQDYYNCGSQTYLNWAKSWRDSLNDVYQYHDRQRQKFLKYSQAAAESFYQQKAQANPTHDIYDKNSQAVLEALCLHYSHRLQEYSYLAITQSLKKLRSLIDEYISVVEKTENLLIKLEKWLERQVKLEASQKLFLNQAIEEIDTVQLKTVLEEDFNCPMLEWGNLTTHPTLWSEKLLVLAKLAVLNMYVYRQG